MKKYIPQGPQTVVNKAYVMLEHAHRGACCANRGTLKEAVKKTSALRLKDHEAAKTIIMALKDAVNLKITCKARPFITMF